LEPTLPLGTAVADRVGLSAPKENAHQVASLGVLREALDRRIRPQMGTQQATTVRVRLVLYCGMLARSGWFSGLSAVNDWVIGVW
jgi:hypothetical protein